MDVTAETARPHSDLEEFVSIDPTTDEVIGRHETDTALQIGRKLESAVEGRRQLSSLDLGARSALLQELATALETNLGPLSRSLVREIGKPLTEAQGEVRKSAFACRHFAAEGPRYLRPQSYRAEGLNAEVQLDSLGAVLAIMPWNFPLWQLTRVLAPAVMLGNPVLHKPAPNAAGTAALLEQIVRGTSIATGVFQNLLVDRTTIPSLIDDRRIAAVTLTGSVSAGRSVAAVAGRAGKPSILELGGSDALIVLSDADVETAASAAARSRLMNAGQSCISAKRFLVHADLQDDFVAAMTRAFSSVTVGDPNHPDTDMGPLARGDIREAVHRQVRRSGDLGAEIVMGGKIPESSGFFYPPTILTRVATSQPVWKEETFGPVAPVVQFHEVEEAIHIANDTSFGLGASVWSSDNDRARHVAGRLEIGIVGLNTVVASDPRLPFGGIKDSGYGRELGMAGAQSFANIRTILLGEGS